MRSTDTRLEGAAAWLRSNGHSAVLTRFDPGPDMGDPPPHAVPVDAAAEVLDADGRTVALSFSSEHPVLREYDGGPAWEVLDHTTPGAGDLSRLNSGAAPLLRDHRGNLDSQIGTVVSAEIADGRGRAVVRIAATPRGGRPAGPYPGRGNPQCERGLCRPRRRTDGKP